MSLPAFSGLGSLCPKCGIKSPNVKYIERASHAAYGSLAYRHGRDEDFPCVLRTCSTCGFQALEAPLSASDTLAPAPLASADLLARMGDSTCGDFPG